nr:cell division control protein 14 [Quercus suber]
MGMTSSSNSIDLVITSTLTILQGSLLLHPPSRTLFTREDFMNLLLDLLDYSNPPRIQSQALLVLVTALLDCPANTRCFEKVDGLLTITSLFKSRGTTTDVKMRTLEFLYFYLMPEAAPTNSSSVPNAAVQRSPSKVDAYARHARTHSGDNESRGMELDAEAELTKVTKTTNEKQRLLGKYLNNVAELVHDLQESATFSATVGTATTVA